MVQSNPIRIMGASWAHHGRIMGASWACDGVGEKFIDDTPRNIRQSVMPTLVAIGQSLMIDAEKPQNRRVQIVHMHPAVEDAVAEIIGRSMHMSFQLGRRSRR